MYNVPAIVDLCLADIFEAEQWSTHSIWIKHVVSELLQIFGDKHLKVVAGLQMFFAESLLPLLIQMLLASGIEQFKQQLQETVVKFFKIHFDAVTGKV